MDEYIDKNGYDNLTMPFLGMAIFSFYKLTTRRGPFLYQGDFFSKFQKLLTAVHLNKINFYSLELQDLVSG